MVAPMVAEVLYKQGFDNDLIKWCMFLKKPDSLEVQKIMDENNEIKKINDDLEKISQDEQLRKEAEFWKMNAVYLYWNKKTAFAEGKKKVQRMKKLKFLKIC